MKWNYLFILKLYLCSPVFGAEFENNLSVGQVAQQSHLS